MKNRILFIALAVVMALSVGLVGCTGEEEEENAPYGTLIYAQEHLDKETFLGWWGSGYQNPWLMGPLYETLTFTDRTGNITPMLLTSWNMATNGTEWTLWVREGVKFQGTTWGNMTAADVKYSIERLGNIAGNDSQYRNAGKLKGLISNITTPETYKVVVSLTQPEAALLHLFGV